MGRNPNNGGHDLGEENVSTLEYKIDRILGYMKEDSQREAAREIMLKEVLVRLAFLEGLGQATCEGV